MSAYVAVRERLGSGQVEGVAGVELDSTVCR